MANGARFYKMLVFTTMTLLYAVSKTAYCLPIKRRPSESEGSLPGSPVPKDGHHEPYRVCYYTTWARYRREPANMQPQDVDETLCTHLIMAFAWITYDGRLALHSEWEDQHVIKGLLSKTTLNPNLKVLVAVGGQHFGSEPFQRVIATENSRQKFVNSTLAFIRKWGLHGLDIDWEHPTWADREKFTYLLRDLNDAFLDTLPETHGEKKLLTLAVPAIRDRLVGYDMAAISDYVDIVNLMAYDFHGPWENKTGHNAPMYSYDSNNMVDAAKMLVELGMPRKKIAVGLPTYGHSFQLTDHTNPIIGATAVSGEPARYTRTHGFYAYYEVCEFLRNDRTVAVWDYQCSVPFAYNGNTWISFDDTFSLRKKVQWLVSEGYGGVMIWELGMDDFSGQLCQDFATTEGNATSAVTFPLLRAINDALGVKPEETTQASVAATNIVVDKREHSDSGRAHNAESEQTSKVEKEAPEAPVPEIDLENIRLGDQCDHVKAKFKDCTHFLTCSRGIQYEFQCPDGTVFSDERGECVWPYEAPECSPTKSNSTAANKTTKATTKRTTTTTAATTTARPITTTAPETTTSANAVSSTEAEEGEEEETTTVALTTASTTPKSPRKGGKGGRRG